MRFLKFLNVTSMLFNYILELHVISWFTFCCTCICYKVFRLFNVGISFLLKQIFSFSPLHISARNGLIDVTRQLLKKGASIFAVDNEGLTPALCCTPNLNVAQCLALILQTLPQLKNCDGLGTGKLICSCTICKLLMDPFF